MAFGVGDKVRVKQLKGAGPTVFVITKLLPRCGCYIVEDGVKNAAAQLFDTSLLVKA
jgi:hypothetical protein